MVTTRRVLLLLLCALAVTWRARIKSIMSDYSLGRDAYFCGWAAVYAVKGLVETIYKRALLRGGEPLSPTFSWAWEVRLGVMRSIVHFGQEVFMEDHRYYETVRRVFEGGAYPLYLLFASFHPTVRTRRFQVGKVRCDAWSCSQASLDSFVNSAEQGSSSSSTSANHRVILYMHGGGYAAGGLHSYSAFMVDLAQAVPADCVVVLVEYTLTPEVTFPHPILEVASVVDYLCQRCGPGFEFGLAGDSAGGGLVASLLLHFREENNRLWLSRLRAACMLSPMLSQEHSDVPGMENQAYDVIQPRLAHALAKTYCPCPETAKYNTLASPVEETDLVTGMPPMLIHFGELEVFADRCITFGQRAQEQGADIEYFAFEGMVHCFQMLAPDTQAAADSVREVGAFFLRNFSSGGVVAAPPPLPSFLAPSGGSALNMSVAEEA